MFKNTGLARRRHAWGSSKGRSESDRGTEGRHGGGKRMGMNESSTKIAGGK